MVQSKLSVVYGTPPPFLTINEKQIKIYCGEAWPKIWLEAFSTKEGNIDLRGLSRL